MEKNMYYPLLIRLTENDKRILIGICIAVILLFVLIGILGSLVIKTMKYQGKKCDTLIADVVIARLIKTPAQLRRYARKKNIRYFLKQAWLPLLLAIIGVGALFARNIIKDDWAYNPFNLTDGFGTLIYTLDWNNENMYTYIFGQKVIADWPQVATRPHFEMEAIYSYVFVVFSFTGGLWYLVVSQAYLARTIRANKLSKKLFEKSLDNFDLSALPPVQP